jgi:hypothetical protein
LPGARVRFLSPSAGAAGAYAGHGCPPAALPWSPGSAAYRHKRLGWISRGEEIRDEPGDKTGVFEREGVRCSGDDSELAARQRFVQ